MSTFNRLANCSNRFQTDAKRVLCVCSAGLLRSPTTANVLHQQYGYNTRAAGIEDEYALIPMDDVLATWADEIVAVEESVAARIRARFPEYADKLVTLAIPDRHEWNHEDLRAEIINQYPRP